MEEVLVDVSPIKSARDDNGSCPTNAFPCGQFRLANKFDNLDLSGRMAALPDSHQYPLPGAPSS